MSSSITRLAPSPTGALHLGNLRTFLINWALARQGGWRIDMRIEDLDGPRVRPGAAQGVLDTLQWIGIDWDGPVLVQSTDLEPYVAAMRVLAEMQRVYPCELTRSEIEAAASAPHGSKGEVCFPPSLRPQDFPNRFDHAQKNWRFAVDSRTIVFDDEFAGRVERCPAQQCGDFVVWTRRAQPAYQLAVVVDDARQRVTDVVRGDDLLDSAARQIMLIETLGLTPQPRYTHLPLVVGQDGRRLAKRHGDTRIEHYRSRGASPERLIGLMAFWCGIQTRREPMSLNEFRNAFELSTLPRGKTTFTQEDDQWLCEA
ncbi:MAG: tRNA glutamyl-Q(34) synthetase GluQRS [Phycisphaerales bacterium]|nr:tRNA glutamyl-Q(34) synthetase GluQRS [Phycisphaerales bacterium]